MLKWHSRNWLVVTFLSVFCLVLTNGCGNSNDEKLLPVAGTVTNDGVALTTGSISLRSDGDPANTSEPYAQINADGTYTVFTKNKPGAPAGKYVVLVVATEPVDPSQPSAAPKSLISRKYADPASPVLRIEVEANPKDGQYNLRLTK